MTASRPRVRPSMGRVLGLPALSRGSLGRVSGEAGAYRTLTSRCGPVDPRRAWCDHAGGRPEPRDLGLRARSHRRPPRVRAPARAAPPLGRAGRTRYRPATSRAPPGSTTIQVRASPGHGSVPASAAMASSGSPGNVPTRPAPVSGPHLDGGRRYGPCQWPICPRQGLWGDDSAPVTGRMRADLGSVAHSQVPPA